VLPTQPRLSHLERWRQQEEQREVFSEFRHYETTGSELRWYDPVNQQHVVLGSLSGMFDAQAQFVLSSTQQHALEVPYQINQSYGLTAISSALVQRMHDAGYDDWLETYVIVTDTVQAREMSTTKSVE